MNLYLMQHGEPVSKEENPARPLSDAGREAVLKMGRFLSKSGIRPDVIWHSGKKRAGETAEIMASELGPATAPTAKEGLAPMDDPREAAGQIAQSTQDLMIVGHLPHLNRLSALLTTGAAAESVIAFQQGGVVCLRPLEEVSWWRITWMLVPELLSK
jgi:phosphohistidine phosphatase